LRRKCLELKPPWAKDFPKDFEVVVPVDDIASASLFSLEIDQADFRYPQDRQQVLDRLERRRQEWLRAKDPADRAHQAARWVERQSYRGLARPASTVPDEVGRCSPEVERPWPESGARLAAGAVLLACPIGDPSDRRQARRALAVPRGEGPGRRFIILLWIGVLEKQATRKSKSPPVHEGAASVSCRQLEYPPCSPFQPAGRPTVRGRPAPPSSLSFLTRIIHECASRARRARAGSGQAQHE
jgi:hypothetical protein